MPARYNPSVYSSQNLLSCERDPPHAAAMLSHGPVQQAQSEPQHALTPPLLLLVEEVAAAAAAAAAAVVVVAVVTMMAAALLIVPS